MTSIYLLPPPVSKGKMVKIELEHIVGCLAEWRKCMHHFARNSSFCQAHAFEVLTPTSTYCQFFICKKFIPSKTLSSNPAILCTMLIGFLNPGSLSFLSFCREQVFKAFTLSVFLTGAHICVLLLGTQRYYCILQYPFIHGLELLFLVFHESIWVYNLNLFQIPIDYCPKWYWFNVFYILICM